MFGVEQLYFVCMDWNTTSEAIQNARSVLYFMNVTYSDFKPLALWKAQVIHEVPPAG